MNNHFVSLEEASDMMVEEDGEPEPLSAHDV